MMEWKSGMGEECAVSKKGPKGGRMNTEIFTTFTTNSWLQVETLGSKTYLMQPLGWVVFPVAAR